MKEQEWGTAKTRMGTEKGQGGWVYGILRWRSSVAHGGFERYCKTY